MLVALYEFLIPSTHRDHAPVFAWVMQKSAHTLWVKIQSEVSSQQVIEGLEIVHGKIEKYAFEKNEGKVKHEGWIYHSKKWGFVLRQRKMNQVWDEGLGRHSAIFPCVNFVNVIFQLGVLKNKDPKECFDVSSLSFMPLRQTLFEKRSIMEHQKKMKIFPFLNPPKVTLNVFPKTKLKEDVAVTFKSGQARLFGFFAKPHRPMAQVLLLHGSGPEDHYAGSGYENRDYKRSPLNFFHQLSKALVKSQMAVFRFDKRGVGRSEGRWSETSRTQLIEDASHAIQMMQKRFPELPLFVLGTSEGAGLALSLSELFHVSGLVLMGGPADAMDQVILEKMKDKGQMEGAKIYEAFFKKILQLKNAPAEKLLLHYPLRWWQEKIETTPKEIAKRVDCPVLCLHGEKDREVRITQFAKLKAVLMHGHKLNRFKSYKKLNHFFVPECVKSPGLEYTVPLALPKQVTKDIASWMKKVKAKKE